MGHNALLDPRLAFSTECASLACDWESDEETMRKDSNVRFDSIHVDFIAMNPI
jgi:hypothetical protein